MVSNGVTGTIRLVHRTNETELISRVYFSYDIDRQFMHLRFEPEPPYDMLADKVFKLYERDVLLELHDILTNRGVTLPEEYRIEIRYPYKSIWSRVNRIS